MATKYHGKKGVVYASISGSAAATLVGSLRAFTLDLSTDLVEVTEFGQGNKTFVQGFPAYTGTIEGFWASDVTIMQQAANSVDGTNLYLYPTSDAVSKWIGGPGWINLNLRSAIDAAVALNGNFSARGAWINNL